MKLLTKSSKNHKYVKIYFVCQEKLENLKDEKYHKVRDHCHYAEKCKAAAHSIGNLKYSVPKNIPIVFHDGSNCDYHFIIKELAQEFKKQFTCLGETLKIHNIYSSNRKKVARIDKNRSKITKNISIVATDFLNT